LKKISLFDAKTHFSQVIDDVSSGRSDGFVVTRHGKPVARITAETTRPASSRIGIAKAKFVVPEDIDLRAEEAAALFGIPAL
jgi:prevent-host-death family protein